ncbi:MAG TPA: AMP-binding protein, partial [Thermodesulfobacteriota bacterium]|nr:AMP-binding protein [Thermodesulfobacteriota bacterium]
MILLFKPREKEYIGKGNLPFGTYDNTKEWQPITKYLERGAEIFPDKTMFMVADRDGNLRETFTYDETNTWANRVANGLVGKYKIRKGDRVGIYMLNSAEYVISIIAVHKAGAVQVPINKDEKGDRLAYVINYSEMKALVIDRDSIPMTEQIAGELKQLEHIFVTGEGDLPDKIGGIKALPFSIFEEFPGENPGLDIRASDVERCMFTSGTTGMPKGVSRNHGGVILTVRGYLQQQGVRSEDVLMSVLTLGHANAQVMCLF